MPYYGKVHSDYQNARMQANRLEWLAENGPCVRCGSEERLEVDHIDPSQKEEHKVWSWSATRRLEELAKCQVLCHKCHKEKTRLENQRRICPRCGKTKDGFFRRQRKSGLVMELRCLPCHREKEQARKAKRKAERNLF